MTPHTQGGRKRSEATSKSPSVLSIVLALGKRTRKQRRAPLVRNDKMTALETWAKARSVGGHTAAYKPPSTREEGVVQVK